MQSHDGAGARHYPRCRGNHHTGRWNCLRGHANEHAPRIEAAADLDAFELQPDLGNIEPQRLAWQERKRRWRTPLALRAHAARIGLQVMLAQRQLGVRAHVESDEVPSGMMVRFIVADAAAAAAVRELMQTFALSSASFEANRAELTATPVSLLRNRGAWHPP
jgi:hypothetical protein